MGGPARRGRSDVFLASRAEDLLVPLLLVVRDARLLAPKGPVEKLSVASWPHSSRSRWSEDCASSPAPASRSRPAAAHLAPAPARLRRSAAVGYARRARWAGPSRRHHSSADSKTPRANSRGAPEGFDAAGLSYFTNFLASVIAFTAASASCFIRAARAGKCRAASILMFRE